MNSSGGDGLFGRRIAPFGNPRINACLPLPGAYRSLPRPSSPCDAKASTVRPFALVRDLSGAFPPKPRARFDCLEIELLMSSHSNFSRLPLSKIAEIDPRNRFFWSLGRLVAWSHGRMVAWSHGRMVVWSHGPTIRPFDHRTEVGGRDWS